MHVAHLTLHDFRSYADIDVALEPGATAFIGRNGQGKTNLVEAIDYLSRLSSHRVATDAPLVKAGADQAIVRASVVKEGRTALIEVELNPGRANRARINRSPLPRPREIIGLVRTVVFAPDDLTLVKGDPSDRRKFLDDLLSSARRGWPACGPTTTGSSSSATASSRPPASPVARRATRRCPRSRSGTTTSPASARRSSAPGCGWSTTCAPTSARPTRPSPAARAATTPTSTYKRQHRAWRDRTSRPCQQALLDAIAARRKDELDRGISLVGPHRDELLLTLGDGDLRLPVKGYASHGESWSFALALRLASYDLLRADGDDPILVLDDVFAELDAERRSQLARARRRARSRCWSPRRSPPTCRRPCRVSASWSRTGEVTRDD